MQKLETVTYTHFVDDVDQTEAKEGESAGSILFVDPDTKRLKGIDLIGDRYDEAFGLLDYLKPYARDVNPDEVLARGRARKPRSASKPSGSRSETAAIRVWAEDNGIAVSGRGRLPAGVRERWEEAGRPGM